MRQEEESTGTEIPAGAIMRAATGTRMMTMMKMMIINDKMKKRMKS